MAEVILLGDLKRRAGKSKIYIDEELTLRELLEKIGRDLGIKDLIFRNGNIRPGLLILVNGADWLSLGYTDRIVPKDAKVRLVPVWHGG